MTRARAILVGLGLTGLLLPGCASDPYTGLVAEQEVPDLVALRDQARELTHRTVLVPTAPTTGGGPVRVAVHESAEPEHDRVLVLIHGVLADHRTWRFISGELAQDYDLMLVDLPGAGASDKPDPALIDDSYSPRLMASRVLQALEDRFAGRETPQKIALVGHSLGGAVVLRMFCDQELTERHEELLSRIDGLVLISPLDINAPATDPALRALAEATSLELKAVDAAGVLRRKVAKATRTSVTNPDRALREEADIRLEYLRDDERRRAAQAMLRQAVPNTGDRLDWKRIESIEENYCLIELPALIIWGRRDETLPVSMGYKLAAEMPRAQLVRLDSVKHSPHIETPLRTVELIRTFVASLERGGAGRTTGEISDAPTLDSAHGTGPGVALHP